MIHILDKEANEDLKILGFSTQMTLTGLGRAGRVGPTGAFSLGNHLAKRRLPIFLRQIAE